MPSLYWFTLNRQDGSYNYFWAINRTSAPLYFNSWFYGLVIFVSAFLTLLVILSPAYKQKGKTIALVSHSLIMGGVFVLSYAMPSWKTAEFPIQSPIKVQETHHYDLILGIHIGLDYVNITLKQDTESKSSEPRESNPTVILPRLLPRNSQQDMIVLTQSTGLKKKTTDNQTDINYNERMYLEMGDDMRDQLREALRRGLPVPILTVMKYLQHQEEGFRWSVFYRSAGYYCQFTLTLTMICWACMNVLFLVIPRYGAIAMITMGLLALLAVLLYWVLLPPKDMVIHMNSMIITLSLGWCFWLVFTTGWVSCIEGTILFVLDLYYPGIISSDLQLQELENNIAKPVYHETEIIQEDHRLSLKLTKKDSLSVRNSTSIKQALGNIQDSGISSIISQSQTTIDHYDSMEDLQRIVNEDGSYLKSPASKFGNIEQDLKPKRHHFAFRSDKELPNFHESTISLHSELAPRYLDSIIEEEHEGAGRHGEEPNRLLNGLYDKEPNAHPSNKADVHDHLDSDREGSDTSEWDVKLDTGDDLFHEEAQEPHPAGTDDSEIPTRTTPRRRSMRFPSFGSHRDFMGH